MSKKHFIALADALRATRPTGLDHQGLASREANMIGGQWIMDRDAIADLCAKMNPRFNRERWLDYIAGKCGPNGGKL